MAGENHIQAQVAVVVDPRSVSQVLATLAAIPGATQKVFSRSLNAIAAKVRTRVTRGIRDASGIPYKEIRKRVRLDKASGKRLSAYIQVTGKRLPLTVFKARQNKTGVKYTIGGTTKTIAHAFLASMVGSLQGQGPRAHATNKQKREELTASGMSEAESTSRSHLGVFLRRRRSRLPIGELRGPSVVGVFQGTQGLIDETMAAAGDELNREILRQVDLIVAPKSGKGAA